MLFSHKGFGCSYSRLINEPIDVSDLFGCSDHNSLSGLDRLNKASCLKKAAYRSSVKPGKVASKQLYIQKPVLKVYFIQRRDFRLSPFTRFCLIGASSHTGRIKVEACHGIVALRLPRFFFDGYGAAYLVKLHHAEPTRIRHIVAEHSGSSILFCELDRCLCSICVMLGYFDRLMLIFER